MSFQWRGAGNSLSGGVMSPEQLAGVIQGEASDPTSQFAVASTMWNRMSNPGPYVGGGSMDPTKVVTPYQYNGYNASPSPFATQLAQQLWNGQRPQGGSTGNATIYAAPSKANQAWGKPGAPLFQPGGGTNIGGNYFSDRMGPPSQGFQPPSYIPGMTLNTTDPFALAASRPGGGILAGAGDFSGV